MNKITIYSTPTCVYCRMAKKFFDSKKIEYADINVAMDHKAAEEMIQKSGQMGVPVIMIEKNGHENIIIGFDMPQISRLLEIS